jgi:hypothetical protein
MSIELDYSYLLSKIEEIGLFHEKLFIFVKLKTKCSNRYDIETFDIFNFNDYGKILLKIFLFERKEKVVRCKCC